MSVHATVEPAGCVRLGGGAGGGFRGAFVLANLPMVPLGFAAIRASSHLLRVPRNVLLPTITLVCIIGAYAINNSLFDVGVMLVMGLLGFFLEAGGFPVAPVVLGLVLGPLVEQNFMISLIKSEGHLLQFVSRPLSGALALLTLAVWSLPLASVLRRAQGHKSRLRSRPADSP